jgi:CDP-diacylglycerol---glycerol-3-phosphate 3-phosphatidyltransferase
MNKIKLFIRKIIEENKDDLKFQESHEVHPHDHLMARTVLRLIPLRITPNKVTLVRIIFTPVVLLIIAFDYYLIGAIVFLLVAFTDAIDGSMARTRNQVTNFGKLFDPLADKILIGSLILLLVFRYYNCWLGVAILSLEFAFILGAIFFRYKYKTNRGANFWGKMKMILQVIAVFLTLLAILFNFPYLFTVGAWVFGLAIGFAVLSLFAHGI